MTGADLFAGPAPRWFNIPAHRPFVRDLAQGLFDALADGGPEALSQAVVLTPTRRGARALADAILTRSPDAVSATKALFHSTRHAAEDQAFDRESSLQFKLLRGRNQGEAMAANLKKREPRFRPRQRDY